MISMVRSAGELLQERLKRRGFKGDDCRKLLESSIGNVILPGRYSYRQSDPKVNK